MAGLITPDLVIRNNFSRFEAFAAATQGWDLDFIQLSPERGGYHLEQVVAGSLFYSRARLGARFHQRGGSPVGFRTFTLLAEGSAEFRWCNEMIGSGTLLVMPENGEFESFSSPGLDTFHLSLSSELLEWAAQQQLGCAFDQLLGPERTLCRHAGPQVTKIRLLLQQFSARLAGPAESLLTEALVSRLALLIVDVLAGAEHSAPRLPRGRRERAFNRVLEFIGDCAGDQVSVADLVREAGVSRRTMESAFRDILGTSPGSYLKSIRLRKLRAALGKASPGQASVAQLGQACGFQHGGQMAADYYALYGETPFVTLRR